MLSYWSQFSDSFTETAHRFLAAKTLAIWSNLLRYLRSYNDYCEWLLLVFCIDGDYSGFFLFSLVFV